MGGDPLSLRFHGPEASRQGGGRRSNDLSPDRCALASRGVSRCPDRLCCVPRRRDRCARRVPTSGPRRSGSRARRSTSSTARSATARRGTAKAMPPRICSPGPATSRPASSRSGRLPTERSRPIRTSSTSSGAACPTPRCPPGPNLSDQEVSDLAYFITTFSPDFSNAENVPKPVELPSAPAATNESIELGKKLYEETGCVKCHGTLGRGDGPSAPTLMDDCGPSDTRGGPRAELDLPGRLVPRGHLQDDEHGAQRHADAVVRSTPSQPEQRWAITDFIVSLSGSNGPGYTNLVVAKHVQDPIDLAKGAASFASAPVARFPIVGQIMEPGRSFHPPATSRDRSGDLRCRVDRPPRSMARHERGEDGEERAVASRAAGGGGARQRAGAGARRRATGTSPFGDAGSRAGRQPQAAADPFAEAAAAPAGRPSEFSDAVAIQIPSQVPTGARKPYFIFGDAQNPVDLWFFDLARPDPLQFTGRGSADIAPNDTGDLTGVASYDQGEWSVIFKRPLRASLGRPVRARSSSCRSPSRSGTGSRASVATGEVSRSGTPSTSSRKWSHRPSARW